jgi:hypothetical protein
LFGPVCRSTEEARKREHDARRQASVRAAVRMGVDARFSRRFYPFGYVLRCCQLITGP